MFRTSIEVTDPGLLDAYMFQLAHAEDVTNVIVNRAVNEVGDVALAVLRTEPGPVVYPIQWKTAKQRRAFFATNGFGAGIPTKRTHALVNAWRLIVVYQPSALTQIMLENNDPARRFVTGRDQQPYHRLTGWYKEDTVIQQTQELLTDEVERALIRSFYAVEEL